MTKYITKTDWVDHIKDVENAIKKVDKAQEDFCKEVLNLIASL